MIVYGLGWDGQFNFIIPSLHSVITVNESVNDATAIGYPAKHFIPGKNIPDDAGRVGAVGELKRKLFYNITPWPYKKGTWHISCKTVVV